MQAAALTMDSSQKVQPLTAYTRYTDIIHFKVLHLMINLVENEMTKAKLNIMSHCLGNAREKKDEDM